MQRINLWAEFQSFSYQPDKDAFADVIRDWPSDLIAKFRLIRKDRFENERISGASIVEALRKLDFWPLDAVTRNVLINLGKSDPNSECELQKALGELRRYSFFILAARPEHDFKCISALSAIDGAALIKGLAISEECGCSRWRGSVSMVNRAFAVFQDHHPLRLWGELADWIVVHTTNCYIPFHFSRTRYHWEVCRKGSSGPEETWRRVGEADVQFQNEREERMERASWEARERAIQREIRRRKNREEHNARKHNRSMERLRILSELETLRPLPRLERICENTTYPVDFYPAEFAVVNDATIEAIPQSLRLALLERLKDRRKGIWRELRQRLLNDRLLRAVRPAGGHDARSI